jgi:hypothetical protein
MGPLTTLDTPYWISLNSNLFVEAWVYVNSFGASSSNLITHGTNWSCGFTSSGNFQMIINNQGLTSSATVPLTTWTHVAFSFSHQTATSNLMYVFVNGTLSGGPTSFTGVPTTTGSQSAYIGWDGLTTNYSNFYVQDLRVAGSGSGGNNNNNQGFYLVCPKSSFTPIVGPFPLDNSPPTYESGTTLYSGATVWTLQIMFKNISYTTGKFGQGIYLVNNSQNTSMARVSLPVNLTTTSPFSISVWIKVSDPYSSTYRDFVAISGTNNYIAISAPAWKGVTNFEVYQSRGTYNVNRYMQYIALDTNWFHVVLTNDGTLNNFIAYFNGGNKSKNASTTAIQSDTINTIFLATNGTCTISDLRVYNTTLTDAQVLGIYQSQGIPPTGTLQQVSAPSLLWSFNGTLNDSIINKAPNSTKGTPTYVSGIYNQAVRLSNPTAGTGVQVTTFLQYDNVLPSLTPATTGQTMACWVKFASVSTSGSEQYFLVWGQSFFYLNILGRWQTNIYNGAYPSVTYAQVPIVGQWYHAASVFDPTVKFLRIYLNGIQVSVSSSAITPASTANPGVYMGATGYTDIRPADVSLSDVRVYNTALTDAQVLGIYQSQGIPPTGTLQQVSAPSLLWSFNGSTTDSIQGVTPTITGTPTYVSGLYGQAINFPNTGGGGAGNYLRYTIPSITPTTSLSTITCWLNISTFANYEDIIGISTGSGSTNYIEIATSSAGTIYISSAKDASSIGTSAVTASKWYNIACVINAGNISGYLNGVSFGSFATTESTSFSYMFVATVNGFNGFNGSVQDLRVYNTALTATQVLGIYQSQGIPPRASLP